MNDYERIASAIHFINHQVKRQPCLDEIAAHIHLSPAHFQRLFSRWAGISPKRFLQQATLTRAGKLLDQSASTLDASQELGLGSSARLHDHFVTLRAVTPGEYKTGGMDLKICWGTHDSPFGRVFIATTDRGICQLAFIEEETTSALDDLRTAWPNATIIHAKKTTAPYIEKIFGNTPAEPQPLSVFIKGTNFQFSVWRALLKIPAGQTACYRQIAESIGKPSAARAVGRAVGANPVAWLIPCHRVIRGSGELGGYRWGQTRKQIILAHEKVSNL